MTPEVSAASLCSGYGRHRVLDGVDFEAGRQLVSIVGANGSGKSTLLRSMFGMCDVYSGSVHLHGREITGTPAHGMAALGVSYMPQTANVFAELTIHENLLIAGAPDPGHTPDMFPELARRGATKAGSLSGGERQLLAMAMALARRPGVMLFDEPTANLSPKNARMVLDRIAGVQREMGNCVILVEQNVRAALGICEKCYLLAGGAVVYDGDPEGLLSDPDMAKKYLGVG